MTETRRPLSCAQCEQPVTGAAVREWTGPASVSARAWHVECAPCVGCGGGPVVYQNYNDQPLCAHCCECSCGTVPCSAPVQPTRHRADTITDDQLDELYAEREQLLAELDGRSEEARERWIQKQLDETGIKAMDFRNGMDMDIEPAREMVAHWVGAARTMLGDAPNYTETPIEMEVKVGESPERFAFTLQRVGKLTPHEARQHAEQRADEAEAAIARARKLAADWAVLRTHGSAAYELRAALDGRQEPRPSAVHIGNRANAEDCPACSGTNPPYPFICPGPEQPA